MKKLRLILIASFWAIVVPSILIWSHHIFVTGLNPLLGAVFVLLSAIAALLFAIIAIRRLVKRQAENRAFTPAMLFAVALLTWLGSGILKEVLIGHSALDLRVHDTYDFMLYDTYYIIASQHVSFAVALAFGIFCAIYYAYPRLFGRPLNKLLSYIHFWVTFVGAFILFWPYTFTGYEGLAGMPRRYLDFGNGALLFEPRYFGRGPYMELIALCLLVAQFLFVFNFISSLRKRRTLAL